MKRPTVPSTLWGGVKKCSLTRNYISMYTQSSQMIECYALDFPQVKEPWESLIVTQSDINRCDGFDDYDLHIAGNLSEPRLPDNPDYMEGWLKNERDRASYLDWKEFCK